MLAHAIVQERSQTGCRRHEPDGPEARDRPAVEAVVAELKKNSRSISQLFGNRAGRHHFGQWRHGNRRHLAQAMERVGNEGVITVRRSQDRRRPSSKSSKACSSGPGLSSLTLSRTRTRCGPSFEDPYVLIHERSLNLQAMLQRILSKVVQAGKAAVDHCGRCRRRSACQRWVVNKLRRPQGRSGQGARLRRPPQGHVEGYRDPHRRRGDLRRPGIKLENVTLQNARSRQEGRRGKRETHDHRDGRSSKDRFAGHADQGTDRGDHLDYDRRNCRSGLPFWPVANRRHPGWRFHGSRGQGTEGSRRRCAARPARRSKKAFCRAAA